MADVTVRRLEDFESNREVYEGVTLLCLGGVPGGVYRAPRFTEEGAAWSVKG